MQRKDKPLMQRHLNSLMSWHVVGTETGGAFAMGEAVVQPGDEPPMHIHAREDEIWYILEGTILFQLGLERMELNPGESLLLPRGIPHGFAVRSSKARILHMYTPAGLEEAFEASSVPLSEPPPVLDPATIAAPFEKRGVTFVGPPLPVLLANEQP